MDIIDNFPKAEDFAERARTEHERQRILALSEELESIQKRMNNYLEGENQLPLVLNHLGTFTIRIEHLSEAAQAYLVTRGYNVAFNAMVDEYEVSFGRPDHRYVALSADTPITKEEPIKKEEPGTI